MGLSSLATIHKHLKNLEQKGIISRKWNRSRSIEIKTPILYPKTAELPLLGELSAGKPIMAVNLSKTITVPQDLLRGRDTFLLRVKGDSLKDEYLKQGDFLIIERRSTAENGELVVADIGEQGAFVKRLYRQGQNIRLVSENPNKEALIIPEDKFRIRGIVIGTIRWYD